MARRRRSKPAGRQRKTPAPASKWQRLLSWRPLAVISLIIWALYFTTSWLVGGPTPLPLKIAIDRAGATTLSYKTTPVSLFSPVCGCARDESTNWRGISFVTRRFETGKLAAEKVLAALDSTGRQPPNQIDLGFEVIARESTGISDTVSY